MVVNGAAVGAVGALIGAVIGFAVWVPYAPHFSTSVNHRVAWTSLPWWLIVTAMLLAVVTATVAARRPARAVAQVPVVAALSGRPVPAKPVHRSARVRVVLLVAGPLLLDFSGGWGAQGGKETLFVLGGLAATAVGLILFAPIAVAVLDVIAGRTPIATRIALRDLARYRARSGPALAASSFAVLIAMLISLIATGRFADVVDYFGPNLPSNQLVVYAPNSGPNGVNYIQAGPGKPGRPTVPPAQHSTAELQGRANAIAASLGSHDVLMLDSVDGGLSRGLRGSSGALYVATTAVLQHYGIDPSAIDPTTLLITSRPGLQGTGGLQLVAFDPASPGPRPTDNPKIQTFSSLPRDTSDPNLLVTTYAVDTLKLKVNPAVAWVIQAPRPLTSAQINTARQLAAGIGMTIESKSQAPSLAKVRNYGTIAGILLALGVLAMTVGLIRSETAGDLRTLTATGARRRTRRTITAATAGALGLLAAVLGTVVAYIATAAFFSSQLSERMAHAPVLDLVLILVGLPVVAAVGGWLFAGREPSAMSRQPLE
jgi:putative ABC transport system permease protein